MNKKAYFSKNNIAINKVKEKKISEINQEEYNKRCFDCQSLYPKYISLYNGIFICENCANHLHKKLNPEISLILDNNLKNLSIKNIQYLYYGGNKKLLDFINYEYPFLKTINKNKLYLTKAMEYYRKYLKYLIDEGEKPLKPSFEECNDLITDINNTKKINKNKNKKRSSGNVITIDFLNNYYNYEEDEDESTPQFKNQYTTKRKKNITPDIYIKSQTAKGVNYLNSCSEYDFPNIGNEIHNYQKTMNNDDDYENDYDYDNYDKNKGGRLMTDNNRNYFYKYRELYNRNNIKNYSYKEMPQEDQYISNKENNDLSNNTKKFITKKISLKTKNYLKNRYLFLKKKENSSKTIIGKSRCVLNIPDKDKEKKIYSKPKHTLLNSFQKNVPSRNRNSNMDMKDDIYYIKNSFLFPLGNNYQSILINNNTFDKLLMYNFNCGTNNSNDKIRINESQIITHGKYFNSFKNLNTSANIDNSSQNNNNNNNNNDYLVFKKKALKNSFYISSRKKKEKKEKKEFIFYG